MNKLYGKILIIKVLALWLVMILNLNTAQARLMSEPYINNGQLVGNARMTYLFWDVYDIRLFSTSGKWNSDEVFALELKYLRELDGEAIAERSIEEMEGQGLNDPEKIKSWLSQMKVIFPDVDDQTTLVALKNENGFTEFLQNGSLIGEVNDQEFSQRFFDIWLGEKTSEPKLRKLLLGASS